MAVALEVAGVGKDFLIPVLDSVSFAVEGKDPGEVSAALADRAVFVSHGDFYAQTVIERLGRADGGLVRVGGACYTTAEEIDRLLEGVEEIVKC